MGGSREGGDAHRQIRVARPENVGAERPDIDSGGCFRHFVTRKRIEQKRIGDVGVGNVFAYKKRLRFTASYSR